ncbi:MAG TPA: hypothetical protein VGD66_03260 [Allosphingosinicella sp.]|jgi:hypothetical protein
MKLIVKAAIGAGLIALAACSSHTDAGQNVADNAENVADNLDAMSDNMSNGTASDALENQADATRAAGENQADAVDNAVENSTTNK